MDLMTDTHFTNKRKRLSFIVKSRLILTLSFMESAVTVDSVFTKEYKTNGFSIHLSTHNKNQVLQNPKLIFITREWFERIALIIKYPLFLFIVDNNNLLCL